MPVLSPRHSSSLSGSYRSTFSSSLSRPYYGSSTYSSPRITTSYTERYSSKSYSEESTKKYSRHASISEDSSSFNGTSGRRETSLSERELSVPRNYSSTLSMIDSVADLRNKYSPSNYVPAVLRKDIERSKSINDIGRPPVEKPKSSATTNNKKVIKTQEIVTNTTTSLAFTNHTNKEKLDNLDVVADDSNGNRMATVAEIRKKFDPNPSYGQTRKLVQQTLQNGHSSVLPGDKVKNTKTHKSELLGGNIKCYKQTFKQDKSDKLAELEDVVVDETPPPSVVKTVAVVAEELPRPHNHTTNFASYIPSKEFGGETQKNSTPPPLPPPADNFEVENETANNGVTVNET